MNNPWCESCARKGNCYTLGIRPKCFMAITNSERIAEQTEPSRCKDCKWYKPIGKGGTYRLSDGNAEWYCHYHICNECGAKWMCMESNFCPNCGADMRGERDDL